MIEETYTCDASGNLAVEICNKSTGYKKIFPLGRWSAKRTRISPAAQKRALLEFCPYPVSVGVLLRPLTNSQSCPRSAATRNPLLATSQKEPIPRCARDDDVCEFAGNRGSFPRSRKC